MRQNVLFRDYIITYTIFYHAHHHQPVSTPSLTPVPATGLSYPIFINLCPFRSNLQIIFTGIVPQVPSPSFDGFLSASPGVYRYSFQLRQLFVMGWFSLLVPERQECSFGLSNMQPRTMPRVVIYKYILSPSLVADILPFGNVW